MRLDLDLRGQVRGFSRPADTRLVGWSALAQALDVAAPNRQFSCVSEKHVRGSRLSAQAWTVFDRRYWPGEEFSDHLAFALRHEGLDLLLLKRIFDTVPKHEFEDIVRSTPTGAYARRSWYLYETLVGETLDVADASTVKAVDILNPSQYFTTAPRMSKRHRVRDNLLGGAGFCPVVRRTEKLAVLAELPLAQEARATVGRCSASLVARASTFLLLADSQASFAIEGETPARTRLERWGRAIGQAGRERLTLDEILRLQGILIEDTRFVRPGLRTEGVFLGERDQQNQPLPEFIGARPQDLQGLMAGLIEADGRMSADNVNPVVAAAAIAFGFVYVHPLADGNGRLHRYLIHHILNERGFSPPGMVFPVSKIMFDRIDAYRNTLRSHTKPLMEYIDWRPTSSGNVEVQNQTADLYRYFDCTANVEFLYDCVQRTVDHDLPREIEYLRRHDEALNHIMDLVEMPDQTARSLLLFVRQNSGKLPERRRRHEFEKLSGTEVRHIEEAIANAFEGFDDGDTT